MSLLRVSGRPSLWWNLFSSLPSFHTTNPPSVPFHASAKAVNSAGNSSTLSPRKDKTTEYFQVPVSTQGLKRAFAPLPVITHSCISAFTSFIFGWKPKPILPFTLPLYLRQGTMSNRFISTLDSQVSLQ